MLCSHRTNSFLKTSNGKTARNGGVGGNHAYKFDNKSRVSSQECSRGNCSQICLMQIGAYLKTGPFNHNLGGNLQPFEG